MGDCSRSGRRIARVVEKLRERSANRPDGGFTLIEVVIAISLLVIMLIPVADAYITSISASEDAHTREVASMLADTALDQARAIDATKNGGSGLLKGRLSAAVSAEWASPAAGLSTTSGILADTTLAYDSDTGDTTAVLPTSPVTESVGGQTFQVYYYVGTCTEPSYNSGGSTSNTCTSSAGNYQMYRVIVDVTWNAPRGGCGSAGCYYITSTLISGTSDPGFDVNPIIPYITSDSDTTFIVGTADTFQVTTSGFPPPTYENASYGNGACSASSLPSGVTLTSYGLLSGTPASGTVGTYTVCIQATNADGTGTQDFLLSVVKASPALVVAGPATPPTVGTAITAASITGTLSSGYSETASVSFGYYGPSTSAPTSCQTSTGNGWSTLGNATASGNSAVSPSSGFTPSSAGDYWLYASYPGDANNYPAQAACGAGMTEVVVGMKSPTLTATGPSTGTTGTAVTTTSISSALASGYSPTGSITWTVFGPSTTAPTTCTTGGNAGGTANVSSGNATYHPSSPAVFTPAAPGDYWWYASYNGDTNNNPATSTCGTGMSETVVTGKYYPTLTVLGPSSGTLAVASAPAAATLSGASPTASGAITFGVYGPSGTPPATCQTTTSGLWQAEGSATPSGNGSYPSSAFTPTAAGDYWWYASFAGDSNDMAAQTICDSGLMSETVVAAASPTVTAAGPSTGTTGTLIGASNITSTLSSGYSPGGSLTITVFGPQSSAPTVCTGTGQSSWSVSVTGNTSYHPGTGFTPPGPGDYWWYTSYGGDANNNTAVSTCGSGMSETVVTGKASPSLTVTGPSSGTVHTAIGNTSIIGALSGGYNPNGTITFTVFGPQSTPPTTCTSGGTTWSGNTASASGDGTYNPSGGPTPTTAGDYWWYASYGGDTNNNSATTTCGSGMAETVVSLASPTLVVTGPSSGSIGTAIAASSISGALSGGYSPGGNGTLTFSVYGPSASAPTTCQTTTSGSWTAIGSALNVSGDATYHPSTTFTPPTAGDYWWYASYAGDTNNNGANSACGSGMAETVLSLQSPSLTVSGPSTDAPGTAIATTSISAVLSGGYSPGGNGTLTFSVYGPSASAPTTCQITGGSWTEVGTALTPSGDATYHPSTTFTPQTAGDYWWYAYYAGDANNNPAAAPTTCGSGMSETVVPVTVTHSYSGTGTTSASASVTATSGQTLLILGYAEGTHSSDTVTITGTSGSATAIPGTSSSTHSGSKYYLEWAYYATAATGTSTVTFGVSSSETYLHLDVLVLSGNSSAYSQANVTSGTSASPNATLTNAPANWDLEVALIGAVANEGGVTTPTPAGSWTQVSNAYASGYEVSTDWSNTNTGTSKTFTLNNGSTSWATIAIDIT
ncbi:MAG TPA: prepilin-type N-terminal cleavage/methylation domain-containing protein [Acidimicrobiales bacterium]|nr:prepilin-type N-terminal cleavage/methylation domain-containing protein [Acidimicrobiales bacterium]